MAKTNSDSEYFINKLSGLETDSNLIVDFPDNEVTDRRDTVSIDLDSSSDSENTLKAAFAYALSKATAQKESLFVTSSFVPHHVVIDDSLSVSEYLEGTGREFDEDVSHSGLSFDRVSEETGIRDDVIFSYGRENSGERGNIALSVDGGKASLCYRSSIYSSGDMKRFLSLFRNVVRGLEKEKYLRDIALQSDEDRALVESFNNTSSSLPPVPTVVRLFRESAEKNRERTAVVFGERKLTYKDVDEISDRIASYLVKNGVGKGDFVPILISRSEWMPVTALGVIKAGAAYQPLDPNYPEERLSFMVSDSEAKLIIAEKNLLSLIPDFKGDVLTTDEIPSLQKGDLPPEPEPDDTFILLYTSGTTGTPKGAMLSHLNVVNYTLNYIRLVSLDTESRSAAYASFGFDANMMDTYPTLIAGGELHILPDEIRPDLLALDEYFAVNEITHAFMTTQVGRQFALFTTSKSLRHLSLGGEKLTPLLPPKGIRILNLYGPTECTVAVTAYTVTSDSALLPIGKALGNVKLYVVDSALRPLPIGEAGELCIAGLQVGRGYYRRDDRTREAFIPNPFTDEEGYSILYRTGDIVRFLDDGNVEFIGRRDSQVKVRGFRIELSEVEKVIRDYPGIKDATVAAFENEGGGKYVAAYVVSDGKVDIEALNAFIRERKPDYMVPEVTMQIDSIPLTPNQKVNRRALPKPERKTEDYEAAQNEREEKIAFFVSKLTGGGRISVTADLYDSGLTSIGVMELEAFVKREFNVPLKISDLRTSNTVRKLAVFIAAGKPSGERKKEVFYPVTRSQESVFAECMASPDSTLYNVPYVFRLPDTVDLGRLRDAVVAAVNAHPALKTIFSFNADGEIRAVRRDEAVVSIFEEDVDALPPRGKLVQKFSLTEKELYRIAFFHTPDASYLFIDIHHIIFDGTSFVIFLEDIEKAYLGETIEMETYTSFEYALDERSAEKSGRYRKARAYYERIFSSLDETSFLPPSDVPEKTSASFRETVLESSLTPDNVKEWCRTHSTSETVLFNTAFGYTLCRYNGTKESVYATVYNGRNDSRLERSVSLFVKTVPMYFSFTPDEGTADAVEKTGRQYLGNMENDIYPFSEIVREFSVSPDVLFSYQGSRFVFDSVAGEKAEVTNYERDNEKAKMVVLVTEEKGKYVYTFSYTADRYTSSFTSSFLRSLDTVLSSLIEKETFRDVECLSPADRELIESFNRTERRRKSEDTVVSLFRRQTARTPLNTAVVYKRTRLSYAELDDLSDRIASHLRDQGIGRGDTVPVLLTRSPWMPVAALGILKSGAAYQPLDPAYPSERLTFMVGDSEAKYMIAERSLMPLIPDYRGGVLFTDSIRKLGKGEVPEGPGKDDAFILLYTSGTTGKPKGALLTGENVLNYTLWYMRTMHLDSSSRVAAYASFGFDASMMDTYPTLLSGAEMHILPDDIRMDLGAIDEYFSVKAITHAFMTTQVGRQFALMTEAESLKYLSVGGEKLTPLTPPERLNFYNIYGPTECTVAVTAYRVKRESSLLPIGRAVDNTKLYVVDENMHILPPGGIGELCISGLQVGKGYLNRPEKTGEVFVSNPFTQENGYERLYRTGDIVRYLFSGDIDFVGRRDGQVKVRGFRIELTEIERVIREYEGINDVCVTAFDSPSGGKAVCAYIVSDNPVDTFSLDSFIKTKLPSYMVPAVTMQIEKIPLTVNQKVDRRALPQPVFEQKEYEAPETDAEEDFAEVFGKVLGLEKVGRDDDFFSLGGSSISAMKVVVEAGKKGYRIVYKDVFEHPTPHALAETVRPVEEKRETEKEKDGEFSLRDADGYDYTEINALLSRNTLDAFRKGRRNVIGDVLLTGCTGYLGIHMLKVLLEDGKRIVYAPVRERDGKKGEERLKELLHYYLMEELEPLVGKRIIILDADVLSLESLSTFRRKNLTVFNCLASVKHFAKDDEIEKVNVGSVGNLIAWALDNDARLVHISTESTAGCRDTSKAGNRFVFTENMLYGGQTVENNKYVESKFIAERKIYEAVIGKGLKAKVMRVGNLSPRFPDGLFQINYSSNGFMKLLRAYLALGEIPYSAMDEETDLSPVDSTAESILLLSSTPDECICFMPSDPYLRHLGNLLSDIDSSMKGVEDDAFSKSVASALENPSLSEAVSSLMTYASSKGEETLVENGAAALDNTLTLQILYRLGFRWPVTDSEYVKRFASRLREKGFFR